MLLKGSCREQTRDGHRGPREGGQAAEDAAQQLWGQAPAHRRLRAGVTEPPTWSSRRPVGTHGPAGLPDLAWKSLSSVPGRCLSTGWRPRGHLGTLCVSVPVRRQAGGGGQAACGILLEKRRVRFHRDFGGLVGCFFYYYYFPISESSLSERSP